MSLAEGGDGHAARQQGLGQIPELAGKVVVYEQNIHGLRHMA
jgi:hypothetical protein